MLNTHSLRQQYKIERLRIARDAMIGGLIITISGGLAIAGIVSLACLLITAFPHAWLAIR